MATATLLPPARSVFFDSNGNCLSGGLVYTYIPSTTTFKTTWQDSGEATANANPIVLDSVGSALIYGSGSYQLTVTTSAGVAVAGYSGVTADTVSGIISTAMQPVVSASTLANAMIALGISAAMQPVVAGSTLAAAMTALGISAGMQPVVAASTANAGFAALAASGALAAAPSVSFAPTSNPPTTLGTLVVQATTAATVARQFLASFGLTSNSGVGSTSADKVAVYAAIDGLAGSSNIWSLNTCLNMEAAFPAGSNAQGHELDFNNFAHNVGSAAGSAVFTPPIAVGLTVGGAAPFSSSSAIVISGATTTQWYRGLTFGGSSIYSAISDYSAATTGIEMIANHSVGIDMQGSSLTTAMRLPNAGAIVSENAGQTGTVQIATVNGANTLVLGGNGTAGIVMGNVTVPVADNTYNCGSSPNRWTALWAVNGTIQTSDPALKTDIAPLPSMLPVLAAINPVTFRWKDGGSAMVETTETQTVHDDEIQESEVDDVQMIDGQAVLGKRTARVRRAAFDEVPVVDADGVPVMHDLPEKAEVVDAAGAVVTPFRAAMSVPRTHRAPRMVTKAVTVQTLVPRPGARTHWGFLAPDVKAAFDGIGMDFGGYVKGEDGTQHLRPDQMIPVLWRAVQELAAEVAALKAAKPAG